MSSQVQAHGIPGPEHVARRSGTELPPCQAESALRSPPVHRPLSGGVGPARRPKKGVLPPHFRGAALRSAPRGRARRHGSARPGSHPVFSSSGGSRRAISSHTPARIAHITIYKQHYFRSRASRPSPSGGCPPLRASRPHRCCRSVHGVSFLEQDLHLLPTLPDQLSKLDPSERFPKTWTRIGSIQGTPSRPPSARGTPSPSGPRRGSAVRSRPPRPAA